MQRICGLWLGLLFLFQTHAQPLNPDSTLFSCTKPSLVSAHPFGLLISRIDHAFQVAPPQTFDWSIQTGSANIWLPEVRGYLPTDPGAKEHLSQFPWHQRDSVFQAMPRNYDSTVVKADGVVKTFLISARIKVRPQLETRISVRGFLLTGGNDPLTWLTSDAFIENFHHYIAGGYDPFARKHFGYNQAEISYQDRAGNQLNFANGSFTIAGITNDWRYYFRHPWLHRQRMSVAAGVHFGLNLPAFNRGIDLGISVSLLRQFNLGSHKTLTLAGAGSILRQRLIDLGSTVAFSNNLYLPAAEGMLNYRKQLKQNRAFEAGIHFYYLGPYNRPADFDNITAVGNRISPHWHLGLTHLYRNSQNWSLVFAYGGRVKWTCYLMEDLKVNNAPDLQTGIGVIVSASR